MGPMSDMCHHLIERKSKVMDKRIRKSKGTNMRLTYGKRGHSYLTLDQTIRWMRKWVGEKRRDKKKVEREALPSL